MIGYNTLSKNLKRKRIKALIDADIVLYRSAFSAEKDTEKVAVARAAHTVERILEAVGADSYQLWLSDKKENNYRYQLTDTYKANRTQPLPVHYRAVRNFLEKEWGAQVSPGQEADDALGIEQTATPDKTVICSIDKDLLQIAGKHYNWVADEIREVTNQQGLAHFYQQLLTGDKTDNISSGLKRMGVMTAQELLAYCETEQDMLEVVQNKYNDDAKLLLNGRLLWIRRKPNEIWNLPV